MSKYRERLQALCDQTPNAFPVTILSDLRALLAERTRMVEALIRLERWAIRNIAVTPANQADLPEWRAVSGEVRRVIQLAKPDHGMPLPPRPESTT